jgi:hypothetical protein
MWWDIFRYPSGNPQAQIFWRRRMVVLAVGVVTALLLVVIVTHRGGPTNLQPAAAEGPGSAGSAAGSATPGPVASGPVAAAPGAAAVGATAAGATPAGAPTPSPAATASSTATPDSATTCAPGSMALRLASDAASYAAGRRPVLTLSVVDIGSAPCTADLGTRSTAISVLSQGRPIWTSNACSPKTSRPVQLNPSAAQEMQLSWDLSRTDHGCSSPPNPPDKGQYEVVARVGGSAVYGGNFALT